MTQREAFRDEEGGKGKGQRGETGGTGEAYVHFAVVRWTILLILKVFKSVGREIEGWTIRVEAEELMGG